MFLVGATGQLLTLILTIGLPFVFLVSSNQKIELTQNITSLEIRQEVPSESQIENCFFTNDIIDYCEIKKQDFCLNFSPPVQNPIAKGLADWEFLWINSSGNKAPPALV